MKAIGSLLVFMLWCITAVQAQETSIPFKDKLYTGGQIGLSFGNYTNIIISPMVGARLNEKVYAGIGAEYQYTKDKRRDPAFTYNQYGGRVFTQYNIIPQLFAHLEFQGMSMEKYNLSGGKDRNFVPFLYAGGGYRQYISQRSFISFRVLFDLLQDKNSPYEAWDPLFSIGVGVGL